MGFYGKSFIFDGKPSEDFDLMLYDIASAGQGEGEFASVVSLVEETVGQNWKPHFYGVKFEEKLELGMVFGVNQNRIDGQQFLDRYELDAIGSWLTGHNRYSWLEVVQDDMELVRYKCIATSLSIVSFGNIPVALKATLVCDGPYAYTYPNLFTYDVDGTATIRFLNESSHNGYYYPKIEWVMSGGGDLSITNESDNSRSLIFSGIPASVKQIAIDNYARVITNDQQINIYGNCNLKFFRLLKGYNTLNITGTGTLKIICEFPINAGG